MYLFFHGAAAKMGKNERRRRPGGGRMPAAAVKAQKSADTGGKRQVSALMAERVGFEPTCPCGQLDFESSSLRPLRYRSMFCGDQMIISESPQKIKYI